MSLKIKSKKTNIFHSDMEDVIINDIKHMDSDALKYLIEHMYPVTAEFDEDCETINISINEDEAPGVNLEDIF
jgi:hypothetical protein